MKFRPYLDGHKCVVYTDHKPLVSLRSQPFLSQRQTRWVERLESLDLSIEYLPGPLNIVADTLSRKPSREQGSHPCLAAPDVPRVSQFLKAQAPQYSVYQATEALVESLRKGMHVEHLKCKSCSAAHLDEGAWAAKPHRKHVCNVCGKLWMGPNETTVGNPLASLLPKLRGNLLEFGSQPQLTSLQTLEPSFLAQVAQQQQLDAATKACIRRARGPNAKFVMRQCHGFDLCYRVHGQRELLVVPKGKGLRNMLLQELHTADYAAHLGTRKTLAALQHRVWWPGMAQDVLRFVRGCAVCQRTKDVNASPAGLLQPLPIPERAGLQWTMDFITDLPLAHVGGQKYNALFVCVDKFSKFSRLVPCFMGEGELAAPAVA